MRVCVCDNLQAGSAYLGRVAAVSPNGTVLTLASDARSSVSGEWKGWDGDAVSVLNGTGAGAWRRVAHSGIDAAAAAGEWSNPHNRTWRIDRPFGFSLTAQQVRTRYKSNRAQCMAWKMIGSV